MDSSSVSTPTTAQRALFTQITRSSGSSAPNRSNAVLWPSTQMSAPASTSAGVKNRPRASRSSPNSNESPGQSTGCTDPPNARS